MRRVRRVWFNVSNFGVLCHCTGRAMPWCILDNIAHEIWRNPVDDGTETLPGRWRWICDRHDKAIIGGNRE